MEDALLLLLLVVVVVVVVVVVLLLLPASLWLPSSLPLLGLCYFTDVRLYFINYMNDKF